MSSISFASLRMAASKLSCPACRPIPPINCRRRWCRTCGPPAALPVFYLLKQLPGGRLGVGVMSTTYLVSLQQAIAFGDHGHAVMVDAKGQVIAHPFKDWVAASRDISGVPAVAAMMRGETGVGQFYSPAFSGNMIAGYAVVPEAGWGVMVPQPIGELRRRADQVNEMATVIALVSFGGAALMAWLL